MTDDKIREVLDRYETRLHDHRFSPWAAHLLTMLPKMRAMVDGYQPLKAYLTPCWEAIEGVKPAAFDRIEFEEALSEYGRRREKLMRWVGFVQCAFWMQGIYTIDEMRADNMPGGEEFKERR